MTSAASDVNISAEMDVRLSTQLTSAGVTGPEVAWYADAGVPLDVVAKLRSMWVPHTDIVQAASLEVDWAAMLDLVAQGIEGDQVLYLARRGADLVATLAQLRDGASLVDVLDLAGVEVPDLPGFSDIRKLLAATGGTPTSVRYLLDRDGDLGEVLMALVDTYDLEHPLRVSDIPIIDESGITFSEIRSMEGTWNPGIVAALFRAGCPADALRDFAASMKHSSPRDILPLLQSDKVTPDQVRTLAERQVEVGAAVDLLQSLDVETVLTLQDVTGDLRSAADVIRGGLPVADVEHLWAALTAAAAGQSVKSAPATRHAGAALKAGMTVEEMVEVVSAGGNLFEAAVWRTMGVPQADVVALTPVEDVVGVKHLLRSGVDAVDILRLDRAGIPLGSYGASGVLSHGGSVDDVIDFVDADIDLHDTALALEQGCTPQVIMEMARLGVEPSHLASFVRHAHGSGKTIDDATESARQWAKRNVGTPRVSTRRVTSDRSMSRGM